MIDLRSKALPSRLKWDGGACSILTDFRVWIEFGEWLKQRKMYLGIFPRRIPPKGDEWQRSALDFYECANVVPRAIGEPSMVKLLDMTIDSPFIIASFQQAYGIDLTSCDMHWHRFRALLDGLPDDTKLARIMSYRGYDVSQEKRKHRDIMQEQRARWSLPQDDVEDDGMGGFGALFQAFGLKEQRWLTATST